MACIVGESHSQFDALICSHLENMIPDIPCGRPRQETFNIYWNDFRTVELIAVHPHMNDE